LLSNLVSDIDKRTHIEGVLEKGVVAEISGHKRQAVAEGWKEDNIRPLQSALLTTHY
jgi:hypothetical protein